MENKERIQLLNDLIRKTGIGGLTVLSQTVQQLNDIEQTRLLSLVRKFNEFSSDNDQHGEHDFGIVKLNGESYYWKIDYYDRELKMGSDDPADISQTTRVMTIMHSYEY